VENLSVLLTAHGCQNNALPVGGIMYEDAHLEDAYDEAQAPTIDDDSWFWDDEDEIEFPEEEDE